MTSDTAKPDVKKHDQILVVEDDQTLREGLLLNLALNGYRTCAAADAETGLRLAFDAKPDLILLDLMLPGGSGLEILRTLRQKGLRTPVLILSARGGTADKVAGLNLGADDYMAKPFDLPELLARIGSMLRRQHAETHSRPRRHFGALTIDPAAQRVELNGKIRTLSAREFALLDLLSSNPGRAFSREDILRNIWGWDYEGTARTVDNYVASLRRKIEPPNARPTYLHTVPNVGYRFECV